MYFISSAKHTVNETVICLEYIPLLFLHSCSTMNVFLVVLVMKHPKVSQPTSSGSAPKARICIFLIPFENKHFEVCGNVKGMQENITH